MSRLSIFAAAAVLSGLTATPVAFAKEHRHVRKAPQYVNIVIPRWSYAALRPLVHHDANMHHSRTWHHLSPNVASSFNFAPSWGYERTAPSVHYEYVPPAYNDPGPNNLGGLVGGNPNGG